MSAWREGVAYLAWLVKDPDMWDSVFGERWGISNCVWCENWCCIYVGPGREELYVKVVDALIEHTETCRIDLSNPENVQAWLEI